MGANFFVHGTDLDLVCRTLNKEIGELAMQKEVVKVVLEKETWQLLEDKQLIKHPKHRVAWPYSSANKFIHFM